MAEHDDDSDLDADEEREWPANLVDAEEVRTWIASALPGHQRVVGPILVHQAKAWGVTASFAAAGATPDQSREVIFKASTLPLFAQASHIYALLAQRSPGLTPQPLATQPLATYSPHPGHTWALFAPFDGEPIEDLHSLATLLDMARTLATIQASCADLSAAERATLPRMPIADAPTWFDAVLSNLRTYQAPLWRSSAQPLAAQFRLPDDTLTRLEAFRPHIARWTSALLATDIPESLDHVDLHWGNAIRQPDGRTLIFDWEEATLSCPLFSLDRLLNDARELDLGEEAAWSSPADAPLFTPSEIALRDAYLGALPWGTPSSRAHAFDLAMLLAPLKTAYEGQLFATALGWSNEPSLGAAWSVSRMLTRWPAASIN